jgi:heme/copper-type cytochrome/quinol oxidase subunit 2
MSISTRRGFVAASGFGLLGLYFVWAAYDRENHGDGAGHGGHGGAGGPGRDEFRKAAEAFFEQNKLADGSVQPRGAEVYLMATQWAFAPATLRLATGVPYRLRMMAMDSAHGAAIALGSGSRIVRLRPGVLVEQELTFKQAGEYLVYCTVYCGLPHDRMQGRIIVSARTEEAPAEKPTPPGHSPGHKH